MTTTVSTNIPNTPAEAVALFKGAKVSSTPKTPAKKKESGFNLISSN